MTQGVRQQANILLVATGGTISGRHGPDGTYSATVGAAGLVGALEPAVAASITTVDFSRKLSFEITLDEWLDLAARIRSWNDDPAIAAILVVQGTALMEEAPFLAGLFVAPTKPVVFTGAMIAGDRDGSDGARNLADAVAVCGDPKAAAFGPLVVMNGQVIPAAVVRKVHRQSVDAVRAAGAPAGAVVGGAVRWEASPLARPRPFAEIALAREVPLLKVVLGMQAAAVEAILSTGPRGLVVEGFPGGGGLPVDVAALIEPLARQIPVVLASRAPEGNLDAATAGGSSGGGALLQRGLISSGALMSEKARLLMMAAVANAPSGCDLVAHVRDVFAGHDGYRRASS